MTHVWYNSKEEPCCDNCVEHRRQGKDSDVICQYWYRDTWKKQWKENQKICYQYNPTKTEQITVGKLIEILKTFPQDESISLHGRCNTDILKIKETDYGVYIAPYATHAIYNDLDKGERIT